MAYYCLFNGTGYLTAPTLGNLVTGSPKIRINIKKFKWFGTATQPIFYQGGSSGANREFVLRNNSNVGQIYVGGGVTGFTWSDLTAAFGDANLTCDEFGFEINGSNANFYKDGTAVFTVSSISRGTTRIDGALLFLGAQQADNTGGSTAGNAIAPNLTQYGDIQIFINDVLVRNYTMPSTGTTVPDSVAGNNLTQRGTWPANDGEWIFYSSGGTAYADLLNGATFSSSIGTLVSSIAHLDALVGVTYTSSAGTLVSSTAHTDVLSGASYTSSVNSLNATRGYGDTLSGLTYSASVGQLDARRGYSSLLVGGAYAYTVGNLESTNTSATGRDDALQGVNLSLVVGSLVSTVQRNTTLAGLSYASAVGNLSASLAYNSALLGLTCSASVNTLLHTWSGEVTVTIEGYTIRYADSIVAAAYANDIISAGYAADILERITWQH